MVGIFIPQKSVNAANKGSFFLLLGELFAKHLPTQWIHGRARGVNLDRLKKKA